jgi:DNA mismatch endonuclease (patch repair protein)
MGNEPEDLLITESCRKNMRAIKSRDTKPEVKIRKALYARGYRYRIAAKNITGKPDLLLPRLNVAIFINGCFWHAHGCKIFKIPKIRTEWWKEKLNSNIARDRNTLEKLAEDGLRLLIVWECSFKHMSSKTFPLTVSLIVTWPESEATFGVIDNEGLNYFEKYDSIAMTGNTV